MFPWLQRKPPNELVTSGGGARVVRDPKLPPGRLISEAGLSTARGGGGNWPDARGTYRALRQYGQIAALRGRAAQGGTLMTVIGTLAEADEYVRNGNLHVGRTGVINRFAVEELLRNLAAGDSGNGFGVSGSLASRDFADPYPSAFIRVISETVGFRFAQIETVQFY